MKIKITEKQASLLEQVKNFKEDFTCSKCGHTWELEDDDEDKYNCHFCGLNNQINEDMVKIKPEHIPNYPSPISMSTAKKLRDYLMKGIKVSNKLYKPEEVLISYNRHETDVVLFIYFVINNRRKIRYDLAQQISGKIHSLKHYFNVEKLYPMLVDSTDTLVNDRGEVFLTGEYGKYKRGEWDGKGDLPKGYIPIIKEELDTLKNHPLNPYNDYNKPSPITKNNAKKLREIILKNICNECDDVLISYLRNSTQEMPSVIVHVLLGVNTFFDKNRKELIYEKIKNYSKYVGNNVIPFMHYIKNFRTSYGEIFIAGDFNKYSNQNTYDGKGDFKNGEQPNIKSDLNEQIIIPIMEENMGDEQKLKYFKKVLLGRVFTGIVDEEFYPSYYANPNGRIIYKAIIKEINYSKITKYILEQAVIISADISAVYRESDPEFIEDIIDLQQDGLKMDDEYSSDMMEDFNDIVSFIIGQVRTTSMEKIKDYINIDIPYHLIGVDYTFVPYS